MMHKLEQYYPWLLPIVGGLCILFPEKIVSLLPSILGSIMLLTGIAGGFFFLKEKENPHHQEKASNTILFVMGLAFLLSQEKSLYLMGITWGLMGLEKVSHHLTHLLEARSKNQPFLKILLFAVLELCLALALLLEPFEKITFHIVLLGIEIISVSLQGESPAKHLLEMRFYKKH